MPCMNQSALPILIHGIDGLFLPLMIIAFFDGSPDLFHQMIVEIEIVQDRKPHPKHLLCLEKMMNICPGIGSAGRTLASFFDWSHVGLILLVREVYFPLMGIDMAMTTIP